MSSCSKCLKIIMIIFNVLILLIGCALLGLSVYFYVQNRYVDKVSFLKIVLFVLMGLAGLFIVLGVSGCCGAYHDSQCLLAVYFTLVLLCTLAEIGLVVFTFVSRPVVMDVWEKVLDSAMKADGNKEQFTLMDSVQATMNCCGKNGPLDYKLMNLLKNKSFASCCKYSLFKDCKDTGAFFKFTSEMKIKGCKQRFESIFFKENLPIVIPVIAGVIFLQILLMVFSMVICCQVPSQQYQVVAK